MSQPYEIVSDTRSLSQAMREHMGDGWRLRRGFALPDEPWDLTASRFVAVGTIESDADAQDALLAATRGCGLVVLLTSDEPWAVAFAADVGRVAEQRAPAEQVSRLPLEDKQREVLELLADGHSIGEAARRLFVSLRTANRRLSDAREALGVSTTREAVLIYARHRGG